MGLWYNGIMFALHAEDVSSILTSSTKSRIFDRISNLT